LGDNPSIVSEQSLEPMSGELEVKDKTESRNGLKIAPFRKSARKTAPHKHNTYFEIVYLSAGTGTHVIDAREFKITPPIAFAIRKEQVHFWNIESEPSGYVIIIKKTFIEHLRDQEIKYLISQISSVPCMYPKNGKTVLTLFELLLKEFNEMADANPLVIEGLLKALLVKLWQSEKPKFRTVSGKKGLYERYMALLSNSDTLTNRVSHYANLLSTTPQNLSAVCTKEVGQSASVVLSEFIISEAKRLLRYTDLSITEVSEALDFNDNSHFTKYFKKHVGLTPTLFRVE